MTGLHTGGVVQAGAIPLAMLNRAYTYPTFKAGEIFGLDVIAHGEEPKGYTCGYDENEDPVQYTVREDDPAYNPCLDVLVNMPDITFDDLRRMMDRYIQPVSFKGLAPRIQGHNTGIVIVDEASYVEETPMMIHPTAHRMLRDLKDYRYEDAPSRPESIKGHYRKHSKNKWENRR